MVVNGQCTKEEMVCGCRWRVNNAQRKKWCVDVCRE